MADYPVQSSHWFSIVDPKGEDIAHVTVIPRHGVLFVTNLFVHGDHRRRGLGRQVFDAAIAQYGHQDLYAHVASYQDRPMSDKQLAAWYTKLGFEPVPNAPGMIKRRGQ